MTVFPFANKYGLVGRYLLLIVMALFLVSACECQSTSSSEETGQGAGIATLKTKTVSLLKDRKLKSVKSGKKGVKTEECLISQSFGKSAEVLGQLAMDPEAVYKQYSKKEIRKAIEPHRNRINEILESGGFQTVDADSLIDAVLQKKEPLPPLPPAEKACIDDIADLCVSIFEVFLEINGVPSSIVGEITEDIVEPIFDAYAELFVEVLFVAKTDRTELIRKLLKLIYEKAGWHEIFEAIKKHLHWWEVPLIYEVIISQIAAAVLTDFYSEVFEIIGVLLEVYNLGEELVEVCDACSFDCAF